MSEQVSTRRNTRNNKDFQMEELDERALKQITTTKKKRINEEIKEEKFNSFESPLIVKFSKNENSGHHEGSISSLSQCSQSTITSQSGIEDKPKEKIQSITFKEPLDFREFLDQTQKERIEKEKKMKEQEEEKQRKLTLMKKCMPQILKQSTLSLQSQQIISQVINKYAPASNLLNQPTSNQPSFNRETNQSQSTKDTPSILPTPSQERNLLTQKIQKSLQKKLESSNSEKADAIIQTPSLKEKYNALLLSLKNSNEQSDSVQKKKQEQQSKDFIEQTPKKQDEIFDNEDEQNIEVEEVLSLKQMLENVGNQLVYNFTKLEECIEWFKTRGKSTLFSHLKQNMEDSMKASITQKQLQQILFLYPSSYQLKWIRVSESKYELSLQLADTLSKQQRILLLKEAISKKSQEILNSSSSNNIIYSHQSKYDIFPLEQLPQMPGSINSGYQSISISPFSTCSSLPSQCPSVISTPSSSKSKNDLLASLYKSKIEDSEKQKKKSELIEMSKSISTKDNKSGLSDKLYQLIKAKEQKLAEEQNSFLSSSSCNNPTNNQQFINGNWGVPEMKKIAECVVMYFMQRKVSNMFFVSLIDHLDTQKQLGLSRMELVSAIEHVLTKCPFWLVSIPNKQGRILRIDKSVSISKILEVFEQ